MMNSCWIKLKKIETKEIFRAYFDRLDGRMPREMPEKLNLLYEIEFEVLRSYIFCQFSEDSIVKEVCSLTL